MFTCKTLAKAKLKWFHRASFFRELGLHRLL
jgi:hypothetical protein